MNTLFDHSTKITPATLNTIAHLPTEFLPNVVNDSFWQNLSNANFMRIAVLRAKRNYEENKYPIGAVIINNESRKIVGQCQRACNLDGPDLHGAACAVQDAGPLDFSKTTIFITFTPCDSCTYTIIEHQFSRVVIGDITNSRGNEHRITEEGVAVDILEDQMGIEIYRNYINEQSKTG